MHTESWKSATKTCTALSVKEDCWALPEVSKDACLYNLWQQDHGRPYAAANGLQ